jgi:hypothetical protein
MKNVESGNWVHKKAIFYLKKIALCLEVLKGTKGSCTRLFLVAALLFFATFLGSAATLLFVAFLFAVVHATLLARFLVFLLAALFVVLFVFFLAALFVAVLAASLLFLLVTLLYVLCSSIETEGEESGECEAFSRSVCIE